MFPSDFSRLIEQGSFMGAKEEILSNIKVCMWGGNKQFPSLWEVVVSCNSMVHNNHVITYINCTNLVQHYVTFSCV